jgi:hypothetical protein
MTPGRAASILAVAGAALALAACGGSSALSRSELVKKADAICADAQNQASHIAAPTSLQDINAAYIDPVTKIVDRTMSKLEALKPDSSASSDWNAYISAVKGTTTRMDAVRKKFDAKDPTALSALQAVNGNSNAKALATKVGATTCAK